MGFEFEPLSARIIEAAIAVHKTLGPGFIEFIYHSALMVALANRKIPFEFEKEIRIEFDGIEIGTHRLDLVVEEQIVVELKAVKAFEDIHFAMVRSYLKASGLKVGLLMNFNAVTLVVKRIVLDLDRNEA